VIARRVLARLAELAAGEEPERYVVAFSGGLDSTALLHVLASARPVHGRALLAVHVHHGLQEAADRFEAHCGQVASELSVELVVRRVAVPAGDPRGTEAAAREQRYAALAALARRGDHVLTAHTRDDQAETLLLNLMRGSGATGLSGIAARRPLGDALLLRPLLDVTRAEIAAYAAAHALRWCEDPTNVDTGFDRNFLRREILPALGRRWPGATASLARSAALLAEAAELAADLAEHDLAGLGGDPARLDLPGLRRLSAPRRRNVLRHAVRRLGLPAPPAGPLEQVAGELVTAAPDAAPLVRWDGAEVRRYRDRVYLLAARVRAAQPGTLGIGRDAALGPGLGSLRLEPCAEGGLSPALAQAGLEIRFRAGGEKLKPRRRHTRTLKKLFQEAGVVPWMRACVPLLYAGERLVAVADRWIAEDAWSAPGYAVRWLERPPLS
jgi:tRNA(Ile)-lysidine synthase